MSVNFSSDKTYTYLKGLITGLHFTDSIQALQFARNAHRNQTRKSGEPYIVHPLTIASHAVAMGLKDDRIIAACLLHDVVEDCNVKWGDLPVSIDTQMVVRLLTHVKGTPLDVYYKCISDDPIACIVKILDRCHNVSTMAGVFTREKIRSYIDETRDYVMPLLRHTKDTWPEYSEQLYILKYHIQSMIDGLEICLNAE